MKYQNAILEIFKKDPHMEISTSEIVRTIENEEYETLSNSLNQKDFSEPEKVKEAKRRMAQMHRKTLYYLNELIKDNILKVSKEGKKGEKYFVLAIDDGEELVIDKFKKKTSIMISKPQAPAIPIEGYEQKGLVYRLEPSTWLERLNSILIQCKSFESLNELLHFISNCFSHVNDVIALNDFESLFKLFDPNQVISFMHKLNTKCTDYGKKVCFIFDITNLSNEDDVIRFLDDYIQIKGGNISIIFDAKTREFHDHMPFFERVVKIYAKSDLNLYIKNQDLHDAPYIIGRAGAYTFDEKEWSIYRKEIQKKLNCVVCSHATVMVDMERFFQEKKSVDAFKEMSLKIANSLLSANSIQRRRSEEFFTNIVSANDPYVSDLFVFSKNYIRLWNYGCKRDDIDQDFLIELLKESKKAINEFCIYEETIYKSCGMPTRFRIGLSFAFENFVKDVFTPAKFKSIRISSIKDFYREDLKKMLDFKEQMFELFDGGDLITFYRIGTIDPKDVLREMTFILNTYKIPFFRYNFGKSRETNMNLANFIGGSQ